MGEAQNDTLGLDFDCHVTMQFRGFVLTQDEYRQRLVVRISAVSVALLALALTSCSGAKTALVTFVGQRQFNLHCASCHEPAIGRAPDRTRLAELGRPEILNALQNGSMRPMAQGLTLGQIYAIATYLAPQPATSSIPPADPPKCAAASKPPTVHDGDWSDWGMGLANARYQAKPSFPVAAIAKLKPKWAFTFYGARYGQPTVVGGRIFITSLQGGAYALDAKAGCMYWQFNDAHSRTTITVAPVSASPSGLGAFFGSSSEGSQTVYAVDAADGKLIWKRSLETHPLGILTGAPAFYEGRLYVPLSSAEELTSAKASYMCCTFRGGVAAFDAATGKLLWIAHTIGKIPLPSRKNSAGTQMYGPAGAAVWSAPTIDAKRRLVYVATGDSYTDVKEDGSDAIVAIDLNTGAVKWKTQVLPDDNYLSGCEVRKLVNCPTSLGHDFDFGAPPILARLASGSDMLLAGQKSGAVYGLDPNNGRLKWKTQVGRGGLFGGIMWGMATDEKHLFVANADAYMPSPPGRPGLAALDPATGRELWFTPSPHLACGWSGGAACLNGISSPPTAVSGIVFAGDMNGRLRAYSAETGKIVWEIDTGAQRYNTVNGVADQSGGNIDGVAGPVIADGMMYVMSGYFGFHGGTPSNVLIAFSVSGK